MRPFQRHSRASGGEFDRQEIASPREKSEDDDNNTFDLRRFVVREPNSVEIRLAVVRSSPADRYTDRHASLLYIHVIGDLYTF